MDRRISIHERVQAVDRLEALAWEANQIASWLSRADFETEADFIESAARTLLAACHLLNRPFRADAPPDRWKAQQDGWHGTASPLPPGR